MTLREVPDVVHVVLHSSECTYPYHFLLQYT